MLRKIEGRRERVTADGCLEGIINSADMSLSKLQEIVKVKEAWRAIVDGVVKSETQLSV